MAWKAAEEVLVEVQERAHRSAEAAVVQEARLVKDCLNAEAAAAQEAVPAAGHPTAPAAAEAANPSSPDAVAEAVPGEYHRSLAEGEGTDSPADTPAVAADDDSPEAADSIPDAAVPGILDEVEEEDAEDAAAACYRRTRCPSSTRRISSRSSRRALWGV